MSLALLALPLATALADRQGAASAGPVQAASPVLRPEDQRVAEVAFRLATAARARCPALTPSLGLILQHLGQFTLADRPKAAAQYALDKGPGVLAVVPGGPAALAGVSAGDVLLAVNGATVPPQAGLQSPFNQTAARAYTDALLDLLEQAATRGPVRLSLLRGQATLERTVTPVPACSSRVHLARSRQLNAFADGRHVFLTTRLLELTPDNDALAFVIAHEMAHNVLGHPALVRAARAGTQSGDVGSSKAAAVRRVEREADLLAAYAQSVSAGGAAISAGSSKSAVIRRTEREADLLATDLLLDAGYRTDGAARVLHALDSGAPELAFLAEHDSTATRVALIAAHAAERTGHAATP